MDFSASESLFLAGYQSILFSDKLEQGTPNEKADVLRHAMVQLQYARLSGMSNKDVISKLMTEHQNAYSNIVDSFDEKTGLNNFAEGALNLCSGHKNESQSWRSSLTEDSVLAMPGLQQFIMNKKASKNEVLPISKQSMRLPSSRGNVEDKRNPAMLQTGVNRVDPTSSSVTLPEPPDNRRVNGNQSSGSLLNLYNSKERVQPYQAVGNQENMFPGSYGNTDNHQAEGFPRMNQKPLFSNGGRSNGQPWQNQRAPPQYGQSNDMYSGGKRKVNEYVNEDDNDRPVPAGNPFRTAKQQMAIDQQKKYGGGGQQSRGGAMNNTTYGTGKKSLGPRRGLNSKFVPPVMNKEDMDMDGNQSANTITRAVLKTGGNEETSLNLEGMDEEKLKGIEPKMIELIMNEVMDSGPHLSWDDIAGLEFAKKTIKEIVVWPMLRPDIFTGLRGPPKGLLLFGPPGTGKTLIGKCIASQSKSTFFCISASSLTSKWVGEGEKMVRALFAVARAQQPAVVFIDEIDSLLTQRTDGENEASRRIKTEFLVQLDGASTSSEDRLLVIGATNRPQEIDEAARRRFVKRLYIPLPEFDARRTIIVNLLKKQSYHLAESQLEQICKRTEGFSGADMATLCREAALGPIRDMSFGDIEHISADQVRAIQFCDFEEALGSVRPSVSDKDLDLYIDWNKTFGSGGR